MIIESPLFKTGDKVRCNCGPNEGEEFVVDKVLFDYNVRCWIYPHWERCWIGDDWEFVDYYQHSLEAA